jgi:hypothetical protein
MCLSSFERTLAERNSSATCKETVFFRGIDKATVEAAGRGERFAHAFVNSTGHCNFTPNQLFASIVAMQSWLETGITPGPESFPAAIGFLTESALPNWPQPFQLRTEK